jgi:hypothetical protein
MTTNFTKLPQIITIGYKIFHMVIKYTNIFRSKALQNLPKLGFFGLQRNHLATLTHTRNRFKWAAFQLAIIDCRRKKWALSCRTDEKMHLTRTFQPLQGCQYFHGAKYQNGEKFTK